jgi:ribonuclease BN (tRNA processing enzyme)
MRPSGKPWKGHMTTDDAIRIVEEAGPEQVVLTHFGMQMIFKGPVSEAKLIEKRTGIPTVAAVDGMTINFGKNIIMRFKKAKAEQPLNKFF